VVLAALVVGLLLHLRQQQLMLEVAEVLARVPMELAALVVVLLALAHLQVRLALMVLVAALAVLQAALVLVKVVMVLSSSATPKNPLLAYPQLVRSVLQLLLPKQPYPLRVYPPRAKLARQPLLLRQTSLSLAYLPLPLLELRLST
jgi:hypothetical protein